MNLFLFVRQALGLSQDALAQLLGIQLGLLKMAEINRRNLPSKAIVRLNWMVNYVQNIQEEENGVHFPAEAIADLLNKTRKKKRETDRLLKGIETKRKQMQNLQRFQTTFLAVYPMETHTSEAMRMNALGYNAGIFLEQEDPETELNLLTKQAGLAGMLAFLEKQNAV